MLRTSSPWYIVALLKFLTQGLYGGAWHRCPHQRGCVNREVMSVFRPQDPLVHYLSHDMAGVDDDPDAWPIDFLNAQETLGLPPHKLTLKWDVP
jgi:hypothetical protein